MLCKGWYLQWVYITFWKAVVVLQLSSLSAVALASSISSVEIHGVSDFTALSDLRFSCLIVPFFVMVVEVSWDA